jgi:glycolate oxidase FAD binding subunit
MSSSLPPVTHLSDLPDDVEQRGAGAGDALDEVMPACVIEPTSVEALAATLAWATTRRTAVVIRGGGTRLAWGRPLQPPWLDIRMTRLNRLLRHEPGDLTVTAEAGLTIANLNRALAAHGQWLPIDTPSDDSTVGGSLATNDAGPLRHRYGTPRDQLIGISLAMADGRVAHAGGNVVKNVAGYDLGKLVCGSFGSLGAIATATFKLAPLPLASTTLAIGFVDGAALSEAARIIADSQLDAAALEATIAAHGGDRLPFRLLVRFAGPRSSNHRQAEDVRALVSHLGSESLVLAEGDEDHVLWHSHREATWSPGATIVKLSWLPAALPSVVDEIVSTGEQNTSAVLVARAAVGAGVVRLSGPVSAQVEAIRRLRRVDSPVRHVVIARSDVALRSAIDVWGPLGDRTNVLHALKSRLDPAGIMNASRGPL